jgi:hypothetical protein
LLNSTKTSNKYPWENEESFKQSDKYPLYPEYNEERISYIDEDKNIFVNESCINISQENNSQYIPFEMYREYQGVDLMDMELQVYFVNAHLEAGRAQPINVSYSDNRIRFGWLVDNRATCVSGDLLFEIRAIGTIVHPSGDTKLNREYVWKTKQNSQITVLKSLAGTENIEPTEDWFNDVTRHLDGIKEDTLASEYSAAASQAASATSEANAKTSEINSKTSETNSKVSEINAKASENSAADSATLAKSWSVGDTGARADEVINNAKYWSETTKDLLDIYKSEINIAINDFETDVNATVNDFKTNINETINRFTTDFTNDVAELQSNIDAENTRATSSENTLQANINTLRTELIDTINVETTRATSAENTITTNLANAKQELTDSINTTNANLVNETSRATSAESTLTTNLNAEISRSKTAENGIQSALDAEITRSKAAEDTLATNLSAARQALSDNINTTNANLASEVSRATTADANIVSDLTAEVERATNAELALGARVTDNETKIITLIGTDAGKSVRTIANEEIAAQLIAPGADASMDTLQEIATWISGHPDDAAAMNNQIVANTNAININAENIRANDADIAEIKGDIADLDAIVDTKANVSDVIAELNAKADVSALNEAVATINNNKADAATVATLSTSVDTLNASVNVMTTAFENKADKSYVDAELAKKTNIDYVDEQLGAKANAAEVNAKLDAKANSEDVTNALAEKSDVGHAHNYIHIGAEAPTDPSVVLWVDVTNGLKYYDGSEWVNVPNAAN